MLIKFFGGSGGGSGIGNYLVDPERPGREGNPPEVVSGDINRTIELIDSTDRKWSYTTGVISFAIEDAPTPKQQAAVMHDFERLAFAGLERDQYDITWVRHAHTEGGRVELHFLTPRMELASGKAFNIAPPGWKHTYAPLRDAYNHAHGWARPDDPARARTQQRVAETPPRTDSREAITGFLEQQIVDGTVTDRDSMLSALHGIALETPRAGKNYITVLNPETQERWRMKGRIYEQDWTRGAEFDRALAQSNDRSTQGGKRGNQQRADAARGRLEANIAKRAEWVRGRFPAQSIEDPAHSLTEAERDEQRPERDQKQADTDDRTERADRRTDGDADLGRADDLDGIAAERNQNRNDDPRALSHSADDSPNRLAMWRDALRKIGGLDDHGTITDRTSALERIREIGNRVRAFGTAAFGAVRALFNRDESAQTPSEPARDAFDRSERSVGSTKQLNDQLDRSNATLERRIDLQIEAQETTKELMREMERNRQITR